MNSSNGQLDTNNDGVKMTFTQRLEKMRQQIVPDGLEEYNIRILTNFSMDQLSLYEQAIRHHHGGRLYGDLVILKVIQGHAQAENGGYLPADEYATLVAYYKPSQADKSDPLYDQKRGFSERAQKLREQIRKHLKKNGQNTDDLDFFEKDPHFTYDLSAFWQTFDQLRKLQKPVNFNFKGC